MTTATPAERPRALVVYESMFGNTASVAQAVAEGLAENLDVEVQHVADAAAPDGSVDLLVVGAPTHAFSLPRPSTRADARRQGSTAAEDGRGLREWLSELADGPQRPLVGTFDTRVVKVRRLPGSAARSAARLARARHYKLLTTPISFYVEDVAGPLAAGELDRARAWGQHLAAAMSKTATDS